jgi:hypothetical protein
LALALCLVVVAAEPVIARADSPAQKVAQPASYTPPPPSMVPQASSAVTRTRPSDGRAEVVAGSVLLGIGALLIGGGTGLWVTGCGTNKPCLADRTSVYYSLAASGLTLDIVGAASFAAGVILLPIGLVQASHYKRWRADHVAQAPSTMGITF